MFSTKLEKRGWNRFCLKVVGGGEVAQTMYTLLSKCKNDKIKNFLSQKITLSEYSTILQGYNKK
jgi:hypothetical protein